MIATDRQISEDYSPALRSLIPLLYAAWTDRTLDLSEIEALRDRATALSFLKTADQEQLLQWSDPRKPPSRALFKWWEIETKRAAAHWEAADLPTLVDLGIWLGAEAAVTFKEEQINEASWASALQAIEQQMGAATTIAYEYLFPERTDLPHFRAAADRAKALQIVLDGPNATTNDRMRQLLIEPAFARRRLRIKEEYREQVLRWCQQLASQGLGAMSYPAAYGGQGDMVKYAAIFEMLGYHDLSLAIKFGVQFGLWGGSVYNLGTKWHHDTYLEAIGTLDLPGCFAMTETGHGSNVRGLETTAIYDPKTEEFIIDSPHYGAGKEYIGNAFDARMASVFAQLIVEGKSQGIHAVLVPMRDSQGRLLPGIRVADNGYKMGLNGVDNGRIWFDQVRVPRRNLLNRFGAVDAAGNYSSPIESPSRRFFTMLGTLVGGRVFVPRAGLSAAKTALTVAIRFGLRRRQFAPAPNEPETLILDYPNQQRRLFPLLAKAYALHFALDYLLDRFAKHTEEDVREIETLAAGLKAHATWFTTACIQECREACGGKGYLAENRFADLKADTDIFTTFEGDNTVLMQLVGKGVLSEFRKSFYEEGNLGVLRYVGQRISTVLTEQNPVVIRNTSREHLTDVTFQLNALQFRAARLTASLAQRLRALIKSGKSAYEAGLECQTHLIALATAFVEHLVLQQFAEAVTALPEGPTKESLDRLRQLHGLSVLEANRAWLLEHDYISNNKSKAIRKAVEVLCAEIRPEAGVLVDAFGIPDALLDAPIARAGA